MMGGPIQRNCEKLQNLREFAENCEPRCTPLPLRNGMLRVGPWPCPTTWVGGRISCQVEFAVENFAAGNFVEASGFCVVDFANTPRNVVVCRALQAQWSLATGANFAEDPGFCGGVFAANWKREISHTKLTAPELPP